MRSDIPTLDELASDAVTHHYDDMIAPSGLTNMLGTVVVGHDLTAVGAIAFPPIAQGAAITGALFLDGRLFESYGVPIEHRWRPDRVERSARLGGLVISTTTVCVPGERAVAVQVSITNEEESVRDIRVGLSLSSRVTRRAAAWSTAEPPDAGNEVDFDRAGNRLVFHDPDSDAWCVQGLDVGGKVRTSGVATPQGEFEIGIGGAGRGGEVEAVLTTAAGRTTGFGFVIAVDESRGRAEAVFDRVAADVPAAVAAAEQFWTERIRALVDPGDEYAGRLPVLETSSAAVRRLYWWGALGTLWFRREYPGSVRGRSYDTLMPNYWATTTFIWDYSLSSFVHALLDPEEMKGQLREWISRDIHTMFGTSALDATPVGRWYSVNDYAMTRLISDYLRVTGDLAFLDERIAAGGGGRRHRRRAPRRLGRGVEESAGREPAGRLRRDRQPARMRQLVHSRGRLAQRGQCVVHEDGRRDPRTPRPGDRRTAPRRGRGTPRVGARALHRRCRVFLGRAA